MSAEKINLQASANSFTKLFKYLKVGQLNDHMLNIIQAKDRTLDFHTHEESDEMFYIIEGKMQIEFKDKIMDLNQGDFIIVPKGVMHRPVCNELVKALLIEKTGTLIRDNTGVHISSNIPPSNGDTTGRRSARAAQNLTQ